MPKEREQMLSFLLHKWFYVDNAMILFTFFFLLRIVFTAAHCYRCHRCHSIQSRLVSAPMFLYRPFGALYRWN